MNLSWIVLCLIASATSHAQSNVRYRLVKEIHAPAANIDNDLLAQAEPARGDGVVGEREAIVNDWNIVRKEDLAAKKKKKTSDGSDEFSSSDDSSLDREDQASKKNKIEDVSSGLKLLPLGVGQFGQGKPLLGGLFLVAQLGSFFLFYSAQQDQSKQQSEGNTYRDERATDYDARVAAGAKTDELDAHNTETDEKLAAYNKNIKNDGTKATTYMALAGIFYLASVFEAFHNPPSAKADHGDKKKKKKKAKREAHLLLDEEEDEFVAEHYSKSYFDVQLSPLPFDTAIIPQNPSVNLQIAYHF